MKNITVCGGDKRNYYLCLELIKKGYDVKWIFSEKFPKDADFIKRDDHSFSASHALILPLPLSRDNVTLNTPLSDIKVPLSQPEITENYDHVFTSDSIVPGINYFNNEAVTIDNARLTAVGFLKELLNYENEDIMGKNALITGYGRVAQAISDILMRNSVNVTVAARDKNQRHMARARNITALSFSEAEKKYNIYDYVINTVPEKVLSDEFIKKSDNNTVFFELAKGLFPKTDLGGKTYIECKGMPGKHTPKSAGKVIADFVCQKLKE